MNIVLIGFSGAGKTVIGEKLAKKIGWEWVDTDKIIEKKHGKITEIFNKKGEEYYRALEKETIKELSLKSGLVISTGGGLIVDEENAFALKKTGKVLYLKAKEETLFSRLKGCQDRPLLFGENAYDKFFTLLKIRLPIYEKQADFILETEELSIEKSVEKSVEILQRNGVL